MECKTCHKTFSKKSNLKRHELKAHENHEIHHHGLQYVDSKYIKYKLVCEIHQWPILDGKIFHCSVCNFSVCASCMEDDCYFCNKDLCPHKSIIILMK